MTRTELEAYDRGFLDGANLRVRELQEAEAEIDRRYRWARPLHLALGAALVWAGVTSAVAVWLAAR